VAGRECKVCFNRGDGGGRGVIGVICTGVLAGKGGGNDALGGREEWSWGGGGAETVRKTFLR